MDCELIALPPTPGAIGLRVWQLRGVMARSVARSRLERAVVEAVAAGTGGVAWDMRVARADNGRPELAGLPPGWAGACSFSYTHGLALGAAAWRAGGAGLRVGVDCEAAGSALDWRAVAAEFFDAAEKQVLAGAANEGAAREIFFHLWTWKEAAAKLSGLGARAMDACAAGPIAGPAGDLPAGWAESGPGQWFMELPLGSGFAGCVAAGRSAAG